MRVTRSERERAAAMYGELLEHKLRSSVNPCARSEAWRALYPSSRRCAAALVFGCSPALYAKLGEIPTPSS